jgi:glycosyltransferase involved in cell wall biosynthesis
MHDRYAPQVFCRKRSNADQFSGYPVHAVEEWPDRPRPLKGALYRATRRSQHFDRVFASGGFDLIHAHFFYDARYAMRWSRAYHTPLVVTLHGVDVGVLTGLARLSPRWLPVWLSRGRIFRDTDLFLADSTELRDLIVELGCPPEKARVHRLGVDIDRFSPRKMELSGTPEVLMVGRLVEKKGHEFGIRAAALARDEGLEFRLTLLGEGKFRPRLESLVRSLGLEDRVFLPGAVSHDQVRKALGTTAVLIAPSVVARNKDRESGMLAPKEASACGVPVVGTWHGGIPEIIDDGETGFLVPERNVEALGQRLIQLLQSQELRDKLGRAARAKMMREYDLRDRSAALEEIYDSVLAAHQH